MAYKYEVIRDFFKSPDGEPFGLISRVAADDQDRIYVFQRRDPPVVVFDAQTGKHLASWGAGEVTDPHGLKIVGDTAYTTDRIDSVCKSFSLDGKVKLQLGTPGQASDTGHIENWLVERAAGPFNHPTEMMKHPNGDIYVTDGYQNARVHRFSADGKLKTSWGAPGKGPGQFHLPHSIAFDDAGNLMVCDRSNRRIQIFTPDGEYLREWTGMGGPNDISRGKDGNYYIAEQEADGNPSYCTVRSPTGEVLAKMESRHVHGIGVDSQGNIYAGLTQNRGVDKFVRVGELQALPGNEIQRR
jgi:DNA-binding beta-propeller fold protein YncE